MASTSPSPASLTTPLLSDSVAPSRATNGHASNHRHHGDSDGAAAASVSVCDDGGGDPFAFLSEDRPPRDGGPCPADPFRNGTPAWGGSAYAWARTLLLAPVAVVRLVLFGLAIAIGYAATWVALRGWADVQGRPREGAGPMPAWRRRLMWITRISARCILFSFG
jgi:lysophosphatidylcholine acyltransferase/lyso-PAF acetyltransferase